VTEEAVGYIANVNDFPVEKVVSSRKDFHTQNNYMLSHQRTH